MNHKIKIISGGQTGADRGALEAAVELKIPHGGWCPLGRRAEDGTIPDKYNLVETASSSYLDRTERNIIEANATIIFTTGRATGGSKKTIEFAVKHDRPWLHIDLDKEDMFLIEGIKEWIFDLATTDFILNIAGSRESKSPGIAKKVREIIKEIFCS